MKHNNRYPPVSSVLALIEHLEPCTAIQTSYVAAAINEDFGETRQAMMIIADVGLLNIIELPDIYDIAHVPHEPAVGP